LLLLNSTSKTQIVGCQPILSLFLFKKNKNLAKTIIIFNFRLRAKALPARMAGGQLIISILNLLSRNKIVIESSLFKDYYSKKVICFFASKNIFGFYFK